MNNDINIIMENERKFFKKFSERMEEFTFLLAFDIHISDHKAEYEKSDDPFMEYIENLIKEDEEFFNNITLSEEIIQSIEELNSEERNKSFKKNQIKISLMNNEDYKYIIESSINIITDLLHIDDYIKEIDNRLSQNAASKISIYNPNKKKDNKKNLLNKNNQYEIEINHNTTSDIDNEKYNIIIQSIVEDVKQDIYDKLIKNERNILTKELKEDSNKWKEMELKLKEIKGLNNKNTVSKKNVVLFIDNYIDALLNSLKIKIYQAINQSLDIKDIAQQISKIYNKKLRTLVKYGNVEYHDESYKIDDIIDLWNNTDITMNEEVRYSIDD